MKLAVIISFLALAPLAHGGPYSGPAGTEGSEAIHMNDSAFTAWATGVSELVRGPVNIANPGLGNASFGTGNSALGSPGGDGEDDVYEVVSLGDGGWITLTFDKPITNGAGWDFAVFENGFSNTFLELAFVEVSSNGIDFFRFESVSLTPVTTQIGGFGSVDTTNLHNLAGKYRTGWGTGFDLSELSIIGSLLDINAITHVRIVDVVGTIDPAHASYDSLGNIINDPYSTPFNTGGFDLDAIGVRYEAIPEPASLALLAGFASVCFIGTRRRRS
ncbi:hypothetical protein [Rariglobus hedericola]|uniref:PEP-CTERM sorting domain-containing protein n=1 Tax=Rariglobus hedericola TaxID=2597822 RepID=A0A556QKQ1_9BACT|nr:hypothetical protein [Rariglobus hedericola]TSJ77182.1 hypothetical protein FPL22_13860 [Rariglobus hedericola]